jgi:uncharacterized integral membrane protein
VWLLNTIFWLVVGAILVIVALQNNGPGLTVRVFRTTFENVPPSLLMVAAAFAGFLVGLLFCAIREVRLRLQLSRIRKENGLLAREVADLRAAPLRDLDLPSSPPSPRPARSRVPE